MTRLILAGLFTLLTLATPAQAQRVALLIANANYGGQLPKLANPLQDAQGIAKLLGPDGLKFDSVTLIKDASGAQMKQALASFAEQARNAEMALVYVTGFSNAATEVRFGPDGMDTALLGVDVTSAPAADQTATLAGRSLSDREIVTALQGAGAKGALILIDSNRTGPAKSATGATTSRPPAGAELPVFPIIYATDPGGMAEDGRPGQGGPFANAFVRHAFTLGRSLWSIYALLKTEVEETTNERQRPSRNSAGNWLSVLAPAPQ